MNDSMLQFQKQILLLIIFLIFPFLSLPLIFIEIYNKKKYPLILLAIFMGGISMFYFPFGDQYRYFERLELYRYLEYEEIFDFDSFMILKDFNIINILVYCAAKLNLSLELLRFFLTFISCILFFNIFLYLDNHNLLPKNKNYRFIAFVILYLSIPFFLINYGFRTGFGASLLTFGFFLLFVRHKYIIGFLFLLFAILTHFFFIIHSLIFLLSLSFNFYMGKKSTIMISIFIFFSSMSIFAVLYGKLEFIDTMLNSYVYGEKYGADSFDWTSKKALELFLNGILVIITSYYLFFKLAYKGKIENVLCLFFILCIFSIPFATLFQRTIRTTIPILSLYLILNICKIVISKIRYFVITFLLIAFLCPYAAFRRQYIYGRIYRITYISLPSILSNHYDEKTVHVKVDKSGDFIP